MNIETAKKQNTFRYCKCCGLLCAAIIIISCLPKGYSVAVAGKSCDGCCGPGTKFPVRELLNLVTIMKGMKNKNSPDDSILAEGSCFYEGGVAVLAPEYILWTSDFRDGC